MITENAKFIVSLAALACSFIAIYLTGSNYRRLIKEREEDMLNAFQRDYEGIRAKMDKRYCDNGWRPDPHDKSIWEPYEEYWYFCYREWKITMGSTNGRYVNLWNDSIRDGVKAGLSHPPLRYVLATMLKRGSLLGDYAVGFVQEMNKLNNNIDIQKEFYQ